jgi:hypothetical protein
MHRGVDEPLIMDILFLILDKLREFSRLISNECKACYKKSATILVTLFIIKSYNYNAI